MRVCSRLACALSHLLHMLDCVGYNMLLFGLINPYVFEDLALRPHVRVLLYGYIYQRLQSLHVPIILSSSTNTIYSSLNLIPSYSRHMKILQLTLSSSSIKHHHFIAIPLSKSCVSLKWPISHFVCSDQWTLLKHKFTTTNYTCIHTSMTHPHIVPICISSS